MSKKAMFYTGFFVVLVLVFFLVVKKWMVGVNPISIVQPFSFINQDGKIITDKDVEGKVYVANIFLQPVLESVPR
jgi:protein SCO1/2